MQCNVTNVTGVCWYLPEISAEMYVFNFLVLIIRRHFIYVSKAVGIRGYFSKQKGVCEKKKWGTLG